MGHLPAFFRCYRRRPPLARGKGVDRLMPGVYQTLRMRWLVLLAALAAGCPAPTQYAVNRPGLECHRAVRVARRTFDQLGYTITEMVEPAEPGVSGRITGTKTMPEREARPPAACASMCGPEAGAALQPIEDQLVPDFEFSRAFGYSFKRWCSGPTSRAPMVDAGVQPGAGGARRLRAARSIWAARRSRPDHAGARHHAQRHGSCGGGRSGRRLRWSLRKRRAEPLAGQSAQSRPGARPGGERVRRELLSRGLKCHRATPLRPLPRLPRRHVPRSAHQHRGRRDRRARRLRRGRAVTAVGAPRARGG